jgi:hypothetical protein
MVNNYFQEYKKTVCIVGNGDSLLGKGMGNEIDNHDIVVRINHCFTINLEKDTGSKCTHWCIHQNHACCTKFLNSFFKSRINELKPHGLHTIITRLDPPPMTRGLDRIFGDAVFNEIVDQKFEVMRLNFKKHSLGIASELYKKYNNAVITTGLGLICYFMQKYRTVNIIGFGPPEKTEKLKHYWPPNGKDLSEFFSSHRHIIEEERKVINSLPIQRLDT